MSEVLDRGTVEEEGSRDSSPGTSGLITVEILERSMDSLIVSDSSEDGGILAGKAPEDAVDVGPDLVAVPDTDSIVEDEGDSSELILKEEPPREGVKSKKNKRRISSRRARKISLSSSDRAVCKIAGVEVTLATT